MDGSLGNRDVVVTTDGRSLAYEEAGSGPPVVLIMGLGAAGSAWQPHVTDWSAEFRCVAADNRGAGRSWAPDGPYTTAALADDYAALMDQLGISGASIVGISMGGAVAQELALRRHDLVGRLVLVSTWARCAPHTAHVFQNLAAVRARVDAATFTHLLQLWIWAPSWCAAHDAELRDERAAASYDVMPQHAFAGQVHACVTHDARDRLAMIDVPTLVTVGSDDIVTPLSYAEELAGGIPDADLLVFNGGGHTHHWEHLSNFNDQVGSWLR